MTRGQGTQQFPAGAVTRLARCTAPLHDGDGLEPVVAARLGRPSTGPVSDSPTLYLCAECLADFALVAVAGLVVFAAAADGKWHRVRGTIPPSRNT